MDGQGDYDLTVIIEWVSKETFMEIHKLYPNEKVKINHEFPEFAYIELTLIPNKMYFTAKLDIAEKQSLMDEITKLL